MKKYLILATTVFAISCNNSKEKKTDTVNSQLIGEWNNISIKIDVQSKNNTDSAELFEVNRPEWETKLKIKPIRSFFRADSSWNSAHYNLSDSLVYNPSGKWWIADGKLIMQQTFPSADTTVYSLSITKDTATFEALVDWDMDGKKDDKYFGRQIKVASKN